MKEVGMVGKSEFFTRLAALIDEYGVAIVSRLYNDGSNVKDPTKVVFQFNRTGDSVDEESNGRCHSTAYDLEGFATYMLKDWQPSIGDPVQSKDRDCTEWQHDMEFRRMVDDKFVTKDKCGDYFVFDEIRPVTNRR